MVDDEEESAPPPKKKRKRKNYLSSRDKRVRVWLFIKEHGLDEETRRHSDERKAQDA